MDVRNYIVASDFLDIKPVNDVFLHVEAFDIFGGFDQVNYDIKGAEETNEKNIDDAFSSIIENLDIKDSESTSSTFSTSSSLEPTLEPTLESKVGEVGEVGVDDDLDLLFDKAIGEL